MRIPLKKTDDDINKVACELYDQAYKHRRSVLVEKYIGGDAFVKEAYDKKTTSYEKAIGQIEGALLAY